MIRLVVGLRDVSVLPGATPEEDAWLRGFLTFDTRRWTSKGLREFLSPLYRGDTFSGGLLPLVSAAAVRDKVTVHVSDPRERPVEPDWGADLGWLYPYQRDAVEAVAKHGRGILKLATGGGKGEVITALPRFIPARWTILVHRTHLMRDLAKRFEARYGEQAGRIGDGEWSHRRVTFATLGTLYERRNTEQAARLFSTTQAILTDEAHVLPADTFSDVARRFVSAYWRVGTTATPFGRSDSRSIYAIAELGPLLYDLDAKDLIALETIARPSIRMVTCPHLDPAVLSLPWSKLYQTAIVENAWRNAMAVRAAVVSPGPRMVFVQELRHGDILLEQLRNVGLRADYAQGESSLAKREAMIEDLCTGRRDALVATGVFNEGVNIRNLQTVVIAAGGKSPIAALQRVGRATRRDAATGKTTCTVWDFLDTGHPTLAGHARKRRQAYVSEGYDVSVTDLPSFSAPTLPGL